MEGGAWAKFAATCANIISWLKDVLPSAGAVGMIVYNYLKGKIVALKRELLGVQLEKKHYENKEQVEKDNRGKSDLDIARDAIREGRGLTGDNPDESDSELSSESTTEPEGGSKKG